VPQWVVHDCGVTWQQVGNRTGHCAACHRTFDDLRGFEKHQRVEGGRVQCLDPATLTRRDGSPLYVARKAVPRGDEERRDLDTTYWRIRMTEFQRAKLDRKRAGTTETERGSGGWA
jgi:hypothetical protein